jgi:hypothetical protein
MQITRRHALGVGLAGGALLALGGLGLALKASRLREPKRPLLMLTPTQFSVIAAICERVNPGGDGFPPASELLVAEDIDVLLSTVHPGLAAELQQAMDLVENALANMVLEGNWETFTASPPEAQDAIWASWAASDLETRRTVYKALTGLATATYWANPKIWDAVGYAGPPDTSGLPPAIGAQR